MIQREAPVLVGDAPVEALSKLEDDPRHSGSAVGQEGGVVALRLGGEEPHIDVDSRFAKAREPAALYPFVGILQGADDAADSGVGDGVGARGGGPVVSARLQGDVEGSVPAVLSGRGERLDLGVSSAPAPVGSLPDHFLTAHHYRPDQGTRTDAPPASPRQAQGAAHVEQVRFHSTFTITCRDPMLSRRSQA